VSVDPRLAARRREVHESWARRRMRWLVALALAVVVLAGAYALLRSPWLAVRAIDVRGVDSSAAAEILAAHGVVEGVATVSVRPETIEAALMADPWVVGADVVVTWPGSVDVTVVERRPAAWVESGDRWVLVGEDGVVVDEGNPPEGAPVMRAVVGELVPGDSITDPEAVAAVSFLGLLPPELVVGAVARATPGGIEADVGGHLVVLGNRSDMPAKVATLVAMLEEGELVEGDVINLVSPTRPGVTNLQPQVEGDEEDVPSSDDSG